MNTLTPGRRWAALTALALGGFGLGLTEFATMGLLPEMARTLLPDEYTPTRHTGTGPRLCGEPGFGVGCDC
ncbi:hypothetical protein [Actinoplanes derwentensis]|uniref:MFS transporter, DHA1 family, inner membrane transport protein n=1 Tax=Actinoplanes derwentensis TaxID=113562 RepID=A0A1H1QTL4_9ACTN|nr:hypothetical protein [Actinoplanes derwentensis]GID89336.1 hypothetical protein Ade03nite_82600 [Actinoplanes derwentensis]SDS26716.1 MFS transporter, DHA1 family, inner membrane transport protein [Actinoplanes derwentensis]